MLVPDSCVDGPWLGGSRWMHRVSCRYEELHEDAARAPELATRFHVERFAHGRRRDRAAASATSHRHVLFARRFFFVPVITSLQLGTVASRQGANPL